MTWVTYALLSAFAAACDSAILKRGFRDAHPWIVGGGVYAATGFFLLLVSFIRGIPPLGPDLWWAMAGTTALNVVAMLVSFRALSKGELSATQPLLAYSPVFQILTSAVVLKEFPSPAGIVGILLVVIGSSVLLSRRGDSVTHMLPRLLHDTPARLMLLTALIYSVSLNFDKIVVQSSDTSFGQGIVYALLGCIFLLLAAVKRTPVPSGRIVALCIGGGLVTTLASMTASAALLLQIVPYVSTIKRLSILFSILLGLALFRERHPLRKLLGGAIMLAGAIGIAFFG